MSRIPWDTLALLALLALSALAVACGVFNDGPLLALLALYPLWECANWATDVPRYFIGKLRRSKKVTKGQKGHACNTNTGGNG